MGKDKAKKVIKPIRKQEEEEEFDEDEFDEPEFDQEEEDLEDEELEQEENDEEDIEDDYHYDDEEEGEEVMEEVEVPEIPAEEEQAMALNTQDVLEGADLQLMRVKILEILRVQADFKTRRETEKPRYEYMDELKELFCRFYGYSNDVIEVFTNLFSPHECHSFLEANEDQRPLTIRANTLKTKRKDLAQALIQRGVNLEPVGDWSKVGIKINDSKVPIGATPEYLCGHYMLQSAASFLPVLALAPHPGDKVLDLAAAPGGKTTYIAQMMKNKGVLVANDYKKERLRAQHFNVQRMGISNCIVTNYDGRRFPRVMKGFDRVLLDAPCSCLGVIARYPAAKASRQWIDVYKAAHLQRELLRAAIDCCKVGGYVLYSTCSVAVEENEAVVDYILRNRFCKVVETGLPEDIEKVGYTKYLDKRFHESLKMTRRVYPHVENMDGFYIAKIKKTKDGVKKEYEEPMEVEDKVQSTSHVKDGKKDKKNKTNGHEVLGKRKPSKESEEEEEQEEEQDSEVEVKPTKAKKAK